MDLNDVDVRPLLIERCEVPGSAMLRAPVRILLRQPARLPRTALAIGPYNVELSSRYAGESGAVRSFGDALGVLQN